ncbi:MAG TPA: NAD-dependent epimerase/dehydratase family protein [Bryobacteraceae bacterium]|nr:NAD-dependent epimerase/dehydratase family protein [Bryobacteraceae bacterium]
MTNLLADDLDRILAHTRDVWDNLRGARLFITGGTGFFGCWLLESFAWACDSLRLDATLTALTRSPEAFLRKAPHLASHPSIALIRGDVRSFGFPQGRFTHLIHGAAEASAALNRDQPLAMLDTIVEGARHALDFAVHCGASRFLMISSGAVYGAQPATVPRVPESHVGGPETTDPRSAYAEGKRLAELLGAVYSSRHGLECPIARPFAFTGPYLPLDAHFAIGNFIADCLSGRPIEIRGDGAPFRSYLYAADLAIWLWTILLRGQSCRAYNVGSEEAVSIADLASTVRGALGATQAVRIACQPRPGVPAERYVPDTARARAELGLEQLIPLDEAIRRTAAWHRARLSETHA